MDNKIEILYLAAPYSHENFAIRHERFELITQFALNLVQGGDIVFSPITHGHPMAMRGDLPTDWPFWERHCRAFLSASSKLIVLCLPGWEDSFGVKAEIALAESLGLPIDYVTYKPAEFL